MIKSLLSLLFALSLMGSSYGQSPVVNNLLEQREHLLEKKLSTLDVDRELSRWGYHYPALVNSSTTNDNMTILEFDSLFGIAMDNKFNESYSKDGIISLHTDPIRERSQLTVSKEVSESYLNQAFTALGFDGYIINNPNK